MPTQSGYFLDGATHGPIRKPPRSGAKPPRAARRSCKDCGRGTALCAVHGRQRNEDHGLLPSLPLSYLTLSEVRRAAHLVNKEWRSAASCIQVVLEASMVDELLLACFQNVLTAPTALEALRNGVTGLPASAIYSEMRRVGPQLAATGDNAVIPLSVPVASWHLVDWRPNVKCSSHRSLAKMIRGYAKAGLVKVKEVRGEQLVVSFGTQWESVHQPLAVADTSAM